MGRVAGSGKEALAEHRLGGPRSALTKRSQHSKEGRRCEGHPVRELLAQFEETPGPRASQDSLQPLAGPRDPLEKSWVAKKRGGREGASDDAHQHSPHEGSVEDVAPRRHAALDAELEAAPSRDRGHAPQAAAAEEVRKMSDLHRLRPRLGREPGDGERRGRRTGGAHSESLADRQFVREPDGNCPWAGWGQATGDVFRDRETSSSIAQDSNATGSARAKLRRGSNAQLENDPGPRRTTGPRVARGEGRTEYSGHVRRRERTGPNDRRVAHEKRIRRVL